MQGWCSLGSPRHIRNIYIYTYIYIYISLRVSWQVAKGPVAALQCYLRDHNWEHSHYGEWTKPGHNGSRDFKLNMNDSWFILREELKRAERWERITRLNQRTMLKEIQHTMDWKPWQQLSKTLSTRDSAALLTWHQGALFTKASRPHSCTSCGFARTPTKNALCWLQKIGLRLTMA